MYPENTLLNLTLKKNLNKQFWASPDVDYLCQTHITNFFY